MSFTIRPLWPGSKHLKRVTTVFLLQLLPSLSAFVLEGSKTSYAQFPAWTGVTRPSDNSESSLSFEFRTAKPSGLLLYSDTLTCEYLEIRLVGGELRVRLDTGDVMAVTSSSHVTRDTSHVTSGWADGQWHTVRLVRAGANTSVTVDNSRGESVTCDTLSRRVTKHHQSSSGLGSHSQYVYVGGLPSWYNTKLKALAVPSVAFEPRFQGAFRNLQYHSEGSGSAKQEMMAYKGVRASTVDGCLHHSPCQHGGECISTDQGPTCICDQTGFKGIHCEQESGMTEAMFRGREGVKYDLALFSGDGEPGGGEPILAAQDKISFYFKTSKSSGLLYYNGHGSDYILIQLVDGGVSLTINQVSGKLDTAIRPQGGHFNDNTWHQVLVIRDTAKQADGQTSCQVTMTVDGKYPERWKTVGRFSYLASSALFLGGSDGRENIPVIRSINNLIGCMKKAVYTADSLTLDLLSLTKEGSGLMTNLGSVEWLCKDIKSSLPLHYRSSNSYHSNKLGYYLMQQGGVISFSDSESFLVLPSWESTMAGSVSFKLRTTETDGLIMYNPGAGGTTDFFAIELFNGFLYVHLNLGRDPVKFRASRPSQQLANGEWHKVDLQLNQNNGRITIDGDLELFTTQGHSDSLDLSGSLFVGGIDYLDQALSPPPQIWSTTLKMGFVGCLKDLIINGADIDIVAYAHEQNSGSIRTSCHTMLGRCHDRPCLHGGTCQEGWNRYICDCSKTSFFGTTCSRGTSTVEFSGNNFMSLDRQVESKLEVHDISLRFRTTRMTGLMFLTKSQAVTDTLEILLESGRVRVKLMIGHYEKELVIGQSLNDDIWHTVTLRRRGNIIEASVDEEDSKKATLHGAESAMSIRVYHVAGLSPRLGATSSQENFQGRLQGLVVNGERILDEAHLKQVEYEGNVKFQHMEDSVYKPVSFTSHHTYLGLPQLKAYNMIDIYFQLKTSDEDGLILYNGGKGDDFVAVELIRGHIHYTFNMGYGPVTLKDNSVTSLADNKYHSIWIKRPSRQEQMIIVDNYHKVSTKGEGDNYHLNLDGILFLGGVKQSMWKELPKVLKSDFGFQGCIASLELNGVMVDPMKDALVPSQSVIEGCQESVSYEFSGRGGIITYTYPRDKQPDTKADKLSLAFITGKSDSVMLRVDSAQSDYLQIALAKGYLTMSYNLGTEDIIVHDKTKKLNDGNHHVVRFERNGPNSTLQVDDHRKIVNTPDGRHLTVFNSQSLLQVGGRWSEYKQTLDMPFQGVLTGISYNGMRPLDMAHQKSQHTMMRGVLTPLTSIPYDYKARNPELFVDSGLESTSRLFSHDGSGDGMKQSDRDTSSRGQLIGLSFKEGGFMPCEDDEDLCDVGSGGGQNQDGWGYSANSNIFDVSNQIDNLSAVTRSITTSSFPLERKTTTPSSSDTFRPSTKGYFDFTYNVQPETTQTNHWQTIGDYQQPESGAGAESTVKGYDEKYNLGEAEEFEAQSEVGDEEETSKTESERGMSPTMSLVIGIIIGSFTAMFLIVIIVLKVKTGVDISEIKQEEMQRYQFSSPSVPDKDDFSNHVDASTSLITDNSGAASGKSNVTNGHGNGHQGNGHNGGIFNGALSSDRARLFKKANSCGRPVREWYV